MSTRPELLRTALRRAKGWLDGVAASPPTGLRPPPCAAADPLILLQRSPAALRAAAHEVTVSVAGAHSVPAAAQARPEERRSTVRHDELADHLAAAVAAAALAVRADDLGALAAVLGASAALGLPTEAIDVHGELDWAVMYLIARQQPDGGFDSGTDPRVELTGECIHTLTELLRVAPTEQRAAPPAPSQ